MMKRAFLPISILTLILWIQWGCSIRPIATDAPNETPATIPTALIETLNTQSDNTTSGSVPQEAGGVPPQVEFPHIVSTQIARADRHILLQITGTLPSVCYDLKLGFEPPNSRNQIIVMALAILDRSIPGKVNCSQEPIPFEESLDLGILPAGTYMILLNEAPPDPFTVD